MSVEEARTAQRERSKLQIAADWLNKPEHDIGFDEHKGQCGAYFGITDCSCERCAVELALAAYGKECEASGLREAERIADRFTASPFVAEAIRKRIRELEGK